MRKREREKEERKKKKKKKKKKITEPNPYFENITLLACIKIQNSSYFFRELCFQQRPTETHSSFFYYNKEIETVYFLFYDYSFFF
jgi:hypothetical protein